MCPGTMFTTPSGFSPHLACAEPGEEEEAPQEGPGPGACLADGPPITSASLDTLIQNLVPTADYYPEVQNTSLVTRSAVSLSSVVETKVSPYCSSCELFVVVPLVVVVVSAAGKKTPSAAGAPLTYSALVVEPKWRTA